MRPTSEDARVLADLMRTGKLCAVWVKSSTAMRDRALLTVREQLRGQSLDARNTNWTILQGEGPNPPGLSDPAFRRMIAERLDDPEIGPLLEPLATVVEHLDHPVVALDRVIAARAKVGPARRRLMSAPGTGPLVALTYTAELVDPGRSPQGARRGRPLRADAEALPAGRGGRVRPHRPRPSTPRCDRRSDLGGRRAHPRRQGQAARRSRGPCASRGAAAGPSLRRRSRASSRSCRTGPGRRVRATGPSPRSPPSPFSDAIPISSIAIASLEVPPGTGPG